MPKKDETYLELTDEQKKHINMFRDSLEESKSFCEPYFQKFVRFYKLYAGNMPPELQGTFSKVMLWYPYSTIESELPVAMRSILTSESWFDLEAQEIVLEDQTSPAKKWARYQLEKIQQIQRTIIPTMQSALIFGTGYRFYWHNYMKRTVKDVVPAQEFMGVPLEMKDVEREEVRSVINGNYVNIFNVFPGPVGGMVNAYDWTSENVNDYIIVNFYMTDAEIESEVEKGNFDKRQAEFLMGKTADSSDPAEDYKQDVLSQGGGWNQFQAPEWVKRMKSKNLSKRRRVSWYFSPQHWMAIGEDRFLLYEGKPLLRYTPLAKFTPSYQLDNWFGTGLIEPSEDLILSMILNFNHRLDYMANTFHPTTFYPNKLLDDLGGDKTLLDNAPYNMVGYNHKTFQNSIGQYVWRDRPAEINQQTFIEEQKMQDYLQEILGQDRVDRLQSETATVGASLISKSAARSMLRSINMDESGFRDSIKLTFLFGEKYKNQDEIIRTGQGPLGWEAIDHGAIVDGYGVNVTGARQMDMQEETYRKMLTIAPMLLNNPAVRGQDEMIRQLAEKGGFEHIDRIMSGDPATQQGPQLMSGAGEEGSEMPTAGGAPTIDNQTRSTYNSSRRTANSGRQIAAGNALV